MSARRARPTTICPRVPRRALDRRGGDRIHVTEKNARDSMEFLRDRAQGQAVRAECGLLRRARGRQRQNNLPQDWSEPVYDGGTIPRHRIPAIRTCPRCRRSSPATRTKDASCSQWRFDTPTRRNTTAHAADDPSRRGRRQDRRRAEGAGKVDDNTLIALIGDNGYFHADRGLADKRYPYEQAIRVPLIVRDPRLTPSRRRATRDQLALNIDVAPTVLAAGGVPVPEVVRDWT